MAGMAARNQWLNLMMRRLNLFFLFFFLNAAPNYAESSGNSTCVTVIQNAMTSLTGFTKAIEGTNSIANGTVPEILAALNRITEQISLTTEMIDEKTSRTYLVGTIALSSFSLVIVGVSTLAIWHIIVAKTLSWHDMRGVRQLAEQQQTNTNPA